MRLQISYISARDRLRARPAQALLDDFLTRGRRFQALAARAFRSEEELLESVTVQASRTRPFLVLLDSRGRMLTSEQFADLLGQQRDAGTQEILLAIGPANGWSSGARSQAGLLFSLGAITLPHELALVVLAEQTYRALTILAGHPYHHGHA